MVEAAGGADPYESMTREQIRDHLCEMAERHIEARNTYRSLRTDASKDLNIWQATQDNVALTVCTMKAEGLTIEDFRAFGQPDAFPDNMHILDPILTCRKMEDDMGCDRAYAMYQHIKTPLMVSNRCCFLCVYNIETPTGALISLSTSKGMKAIEQANVVLQGKDVLSNTILTYNKMEPCEDGVRVSAVLCVDPAGSLPDFVKNKIAAQNSNTAENMVKHLRKKKGLAP